jgi:hypothetical protein
MLLFDFYLCHILQIEFMRSKGGKTVKEATLRILKSMIEPAFQPSFNRTGLHEKIPFADYLEPLFKGNYVILC